MIVVRVRILILTMVATIDIIFIMAVSIENKEKQYEKAKYNIDILQSKLETKTSQVVSLEENKEFWKTNYDTISKMYQELQKENKKVMTSLRTLEKNMEDKKSCSCKLQLVKEEKKIELERGRRWGRERREIKIICFIHPPPYPDRTEFNVMFPTTIV